MPRGRPRKPKPPPTPWRVHALGVERLSPYFMARGADLVGNREAVRRFLFELEGADRESFLLCWAEYLAQRLERSEERRSPVRERTGRASNGSASTSGVV